MLWCREVYGGPQLFPYYAERRQFFQLGFFFFVDAFARFGGLMTEQIKEDSAEKSFRILLNQTKFRLQLHFPDWIGIKRNSVWCQIWEIILFRFKTISTLGMWCKTLVPKTRRENHRRTQRNLCEILLNRTEIRLYLPFSDWYGTERSPFGSISIGKW